MNISLLDVEGELASAPLSRFHLRIALMLSSLIIFDGYDTVNPSYVVGYLAHAWHLSPGQVGMLISSGLIGFLFGSAFHGIVADRIGRRSVLLYSLLLAAICTVLTPVLSTGPVEFCLVRLATGIGLGVLMPLATTYMCEFAPQRFSNLLPVWAVALGWTIGAAGASFASALLLPRFGWQILYYLGAIAFVLFAVAYICLPESIRFLALEGREPEIRRLLARLCPERSERFRTAPIQCVRQRAARGNWTALLSPLYRRTSLTIWAASSLSLFGVYALTGWVPNVMIQRGEHFFAGFLFGAVLQVASFIGAVLGGYLIDRTGSSGRWMACLWGLGAVSMMLLVFVNSHIVNLIAISVAGLGIPGGQFLLNNFTARSYKTEVRATAVGTELAVGRLGAILGPYLAGLLEQHYHSANSLFIAVASTSILASVCILTLPSRVSGSLLRSGSQAEFDPDAQDDTATSVPEVA